MYGSALGVPRVAFCVLFDLGCLSACGCLCACAFMFEFVCGCPRARVLQSSLHVDVLPLEAIVCASDGAALVSHMRALALQCSLLPRSPPGQERVCYSSSLPLSRRLCLSMWETESDASA